MLKAQSPRRLDERSLPILRTNQLERQQEAKEPSQEGRQVEVGAGQSVMRI